MSSRSLLGWLALTATAALSGCGSAKFTAEELVAELNEHGAALEVGEPLDSGPDAVEAHTLRFADPAGEDARDTHAGGTILIAEDDDAALAEYRRCEGAASLVCFRAANGVLILSEAIPREDLASVRQAVRALGDG